jgi:AraC family transcriptional regulator
MMLVGRCAAQSLQIGQQSVCDVIQPRLDVIPGDVAERTFVRWSGLAAETVRYASRGPFEYRFCASSHMLIACRRAVRRAGESSIGRAIKSSRRDIGRTLTLVPAGDAFRGTFVPQVLPRATYIYLDPEVLFVDDASGYAKLDPKPRLFFENATLWTTATKLQTLIQTPGAGSRLYGDTLAVLLLVELLRLEDGNATKPASARGGLAPWQLQRVRDFIEHHLADDTALSELARLTGLSPTHFCRAFKRSVGLAPHQYRLRRRIERAKALLADPERAVTEIAFDCGYGLPGSFATAFRKATGATPSAYRRALGYK